MKPYQLLLSIGLVVCPLAVHAQTITSSVSDATDSVYNLSASQAWAYYGTSSNNNFVPETGSFETAVNTGNFSSITGTPSQSGQSTATSFDVIGGDSLSDSDQAVYVNNYLPNGATFTSTLFASSEVFNLFLTTYQGDAIVGATVTDASGATVGTYSLSSGLFLPGTNFGSNVNDDGLHGYGDVAVTLSGFTAGDTVTFLVNAASSDPSNSSISYWATGLSGVTADAVATPEPSTWLMLGVGMSALFFVRRFRAQV
jgi:PEP-CTERM motif